MKRIILLLTFFLIISAAETVCAAQYTVFLKSGGTIEASDYVKEGENINVLLRGSENAFVLVHRKDIDKIIRDDDQKKKGTDEEIKYIEPCDTVSCSRFNYGCCDTLNGWTKVRDSRCEAAANPPDKDDALKIKLDESTCKTYRERVARLEEECPNCALLFSCCGWKLY